MRRLRFALLALMVVVAACASGDPSAVIEKFVAANNMGDTEAMIALFAEDGVYVTGEGFEYEAGQRLRGRIEDRYSRGQPIDSTELIIVAVDGNDISFDYNFIAIDGSCWRITGYRAIIMEDKILRYEAAPQDNYIPQDCG